MTNYYQIGKRLTLLYPDLARTLVQQETPRMNLDSRLPEIYKKYQSYRSIPTTKKEQTHQKMEFVAIIVMHVDHDALYTDKPLSKGIRPMLAKVLCCKPCEISNSLKIVRNHLDIYKDFQQAVEYLYSELFD